jgi:uncharacterized protein YndB with AHSA1/START domain
MTGTQGQLGKVSRRLESASRDSRPVRVLLAAQSYGTDLPDLWEAVTAPERLSRWFLPVSGDLRLHGRYQVEGNASGQVLACDPPNSYSITWEFGGDVSWVEVSLTAEPSGRPTLELRHSAQVEDERWREFGPGAVGIGWDTTLLGLAQHLGADLGVGPSNAAAWMASDDGKQFITRSGQHWQAAAVAAGEEPGQAAAAAHRCIAAYTGEPPG